MHDAYDDGAIIEATTPKATVDEIQYAQDMFLSAFSADTGKFGREVGILKRIRESPDAATNELRGSPETRRSHAERLGAFSGYETQAYVLEGVWVRTVAPLLTTPTAQMVNMR